jgi:hypothetical protein
MPDLEITQDSGLIMLNSSSVDCLGKWDLVRMQVFPHRLSYELARFVSQDIFHALGSSLNATIPR